MNILNSQEEFKEITNINISKYAQDKNPRGIRMEPEEFEKYLIDTRPNIIINERSNGVEYHNSIEKLCKELEITTICVLDLNLGNGNRFKEEPDYITVPSKSIKAELIDVGIKKEKVFVCGNPAFDYIYELNYAKVVNRDNPRILYVSQGKLYEDRYKQIHSDVSEVFKEFSIDIKLHPQEDEFCMYGYNDYKNTVVINHNNTTDFTPKCLEYDMILGVESTIQIKTNLMGIPTIFANGETELKELLKMFKESRQLPIYKYNDFERDATTKVIKKIKDIIDVVIMNK